jgi:hypothetical protein
VTGGAAESLVALFAGGGSRSMRAARRAGPEDRAGGRTKARGDRVTCLRCRADNSPGRRFCGECGAPLAVPCRACGFANESGAK